MSSYWDKVKSKPVPSANIVKEPVSSGSYWEKVKTPVLEKDLVSTETKPIDNFQYEGYSGVTPNKPGESNFLRGAKVAIKQVPELAYGATALTARTVEPTLNKLSAAMPYFAGPGDPTGGGMAAVMAREASEKAKKDPFASKTPITDWAMKGYQHASQNTAIDARENDNIVIAFRKAKNGNYGALLDSVSYGLGYGLSQAGISMAVGIAGGLAGGAVLPSTLAAGGTGAIRGLIEKGIEKEIKKTMLKGLSYEAAKKIVVKETAQVLGATASSIALNTMMEAGQIGPALIENKGEDINAGDLLRAWGSVAAAAGTESVTDLLGLGAVTGRIKIPGKMGRFAKAGVGGAIGTGIEGVQEATQSVIERFGSQSPITGDEAWIDYLNSAFMGGLTGGTIGAFSGAIQKVNRTEKEKTKILSKSLDVEPKVFQELSAPIITVDDKTVPISIDRPSDKTFNSAISQSRKRERNLKILDEQIYDKIKKATGLEPVFDWRKGEEGDLSLFNPMAKTQLETLIKMRNAVADGVEVSEIKNSYITAQDAKNYIDQEIAKARKNTRKEFLKFQKEKKKANLKEIEYFSNVSVETADGTGEKKEKAILPNNEQATSYYPYINNVLNEIRTSEETRASEDPTYTPKNIPNAENLNNIIRDNLLSDIIKIIEGTGNDEDVMTFLRDRLVNNDKQEYSFISAHENKSDSPKTKIYDWKRFTEVEIRDAARNLKQFNYQRELNQEEPIPLSNVIIHKNIWKNQTPGIAKKIRETFIDEYNRAPLDKVVKKPTLPPASESIAEPTPTPTPIPEILPTVDELRIEQAKVALRQEGVTQGTLENPTIGDIWDKHAQGDYVVIGTNQGGVHGRGLAKQALTKNLVEKKKNGTFEDSNFKDRILSIAVKRHWSDKTTGKNLDLMKSEIDKLINFAEKNPDKTIWVPFLGMGFGEGIKEEIYPILNNLSNLNNINFIAREEGVVGKYAETFKPGARTDKAAMAELEALSQPKRVAIVGSRDFPSEQAVRDYVKSLSKETIVISGAARGVDSWAADEARKQGLEVIEYKADWSKGKGAGIARNADIVKNADEVVAFQYNKSRGTQDSIDRARKSNKRVTVIDETYGYGLEEKQDTKEEEAKKEIAVEKKKTKKKREVVENKHQIQDLYEIASELQKTLGRVPSPEELAQAVGVSVQEIRDLRADGFKEIYPEISQNEFNNMTISENNILELSVIKDELEQLYGSMSTQTQQDALWLLEKGIERIKGNKRRYYYKSLFQKEYKSKADLEKIALGLKWGFGDELPPAEDAAYWRKKRNKLQYQDVAKKILNLRRIAEEIIKSRPVLIEISLKEIEKKKEFMSESSRQEINKILSKLNKNSSPDQIQFLIKELNDTIRKENETAKYTAKLSEDEKGGGATFFFSEPLVVQTKNGDIEAPVGEYNLSKTDDGFSIVINGESFNLEKTELSRIAKDYRVEVDYERYVDVVESEDKPFSVDPEPWKRMGESGQLSWTTKFERWSNRILKHTPAERRSPAMLVLYKMRNLPFMKKINDSRSEAQRRKFEQKIRPLYAVEDTPHSLIHSWKVYESSVMTVAHDEMSPLIDDAIENIQNFLIDKGEKGNKKEVFQPVLDIYTQIMSRASQEILVNSYDPNNYAPTRNGVGPFQNSDEVNAYVEDVKKFCEILKLPVPPEGTQDILDPYTQRPTGMSSEIGTLRNGRNMFFWNLLVNPNVMNNDSLQRIIMFYKAQIEMPLLEEEIRNGIYADSDIWRIIQDGYHKRAFDKKGQQAGAEGFQKTGGLSGVSRPKRTFKTHEEFVKAGKEEGWLPVDDFFNDNMDYIIEALRGIKQAQLLSEIKKVPMKGGIEYEEGSELYKLNKENPSPYTFFWVQNTADENIVNEAKRIVNLIKKANPNSDIKEERIIERILQEGGWIMANEAKGLDTWYKGSFLPPYLYRTLYDEVQTYWQKTQSFDELGTFSKIMQYLKMILTIMPTDASAQYLGLISSEQSAWKVIPYTLGIIPRTIYYGGKGLFAGTKSLITGKKSSAETATNDYEQNIADRLFAEGLPAVGGYKQFLMNFIDKADKGIFAQRRTKLEDISDWTWTAFGSYEGIMTEMISRDVLKASIKIVEQKVAMGMNLDEAIKRTVAYMNTASWQLHRSSFQGKFGDHLRNLTISRNFAAVPIRSIFIAMHNAPVVGKAMQKAGVYNFKTGKSQWTNVFTGAEIPKRMMDETSSKLIGSFMRLLALDIFIKMTLQYALSHMDDDELDFHSEIGDYVENPKKRNMWNNPGGLKGALYSGLKNINGSPLFFDFGLFKLVNNVFDIVSTVVEPAIKLTTGKDVDVGKGLYSYLKSKSFLVAYEVAFNREIDSNKEIFDVNGSINDNFVRLLSKALPGPINPWFGESEVRVPYSEDPLVDNILRASTIFSVAIKTGQPYDENITSEEMRKMKQEIKSYDIKQGELTDNLYTEESLRAARDKEVISGASYKERIKSLRHGAKYFFRKNRRKIREIEESY
jgi:hypothetical protein